MLCPQAVRTEMMRGLEDHVAAIDGMLEPEPVADACVQAIRDEVFLVLPHPQQSPRLRDQGPDAHTCVVNWHGCVYRGICNARHHIIALSDN